MEIPERADITISESDDRVTISLRGSQGQARIGGSDFHGYVFLYDDEGREHLRLDGRNAALYAGGEGEPGRVFLRKTVDAGSGEADRVTMRLDGDNGNIRAGGNGCDGDLLLFPEDSADIRTDAEATIWLDSGNGNIRAGGGGSDGDLLLFPEGVSDIRRDGEATIWLDSGHGNIRAGGSGCDGDLLLFPEEVGDIRRDSQATIWLDSGRGNIALGGNGHDGDLLIFPSDATISTTRTGDAKLWLDGDSGDVRLAGGLKPMGSPERARALPEYSTNEGAVSSFESDGRFGLIEFTHEHPDARGDREKLRNIQIFNPLLHDNTIVQVTAHAGGPCVPCISYYARPDVSGGSGYFINLHMVRKLQPGREVRILYWIMN